jgi:hypothetical protein
MRNKFALLCIIIQGLQSALASPNVFVTHTNIFSGEVASGLTDGAPLVVSSTGKITTGINFNEITSTSNVTTTSASDVAFTGITYTPVAGTWQCIFSTWLTHSSGNATITMSYYIGGVQNAASVRTIIPFVGALSAITQDIPITMHGIFAVNGSQAIAIEWHTSTGTATAHQQTFDCLRIQ